MSASTSTSLVLLVAALVGGCVNPKSVGEAIEAEPGGDGSSTGTTESGPPPGPGATAGPDSGLTTTDGPEPTGTTAPLDPTTSDTGGSWIMGSDGGIVDPCDPWAQDCDQGEKCTPSAMEEGGNAWDWARCSPVVPVPAAVGEPCTVEGFATSGIDTCELGAMCWDVDPGTLEGTCVALCTGSEDSPECAPEGTACAIANDAWLILCLPACEPIMQDCEPGDVCTPVGDVWVCSPEGGNASGVGESCDVLGICDPGLLCVEPELVPDCQDGACCTPICDVTDPMPPCLPGQSCEPYYEPGMAPAGFENVGICTLPA